MATARAERAVPGFYYNTNGFAHHRLEDAVAVLADLGYEGVGLTPDVRHLDPLRAGPDEVRDLRRLLERRGLGVVVETGARFLLDPRRKHRPSLLDPPPQARRRLELLERCVDLGAALGASVVSTWSGAGPDGQPRPEAWGRLAEGLSRLCDHAARSGLRVGFEPEPGMLVERAADWPALRDRIGHEALGLTLDVGHCLATGEGDPAGIVREHAADLLVLHLDDHRPGAHEHLAPGDGVVDFVAVGRAVAESGFAGPLEVELSRHSATAPATARRALAFLRDAFRPAPHPPAP